MSKRQHHLLEFDDKNRIIGWKCFNCAASGNFPNYNDILSNPCRYCGLINVELIESFGLAIALIEAKRKGELIYNMDKVELHAQFFNRAVEVISALDFPKLQEFIEENEKILIEARANISAAKDEARKRLAKLKPESKEWLVTGDEVDGSISNSLLTKKPRKTKLDKLVDTYAELGIEMPDELKAKIQKKQTEADFRNSPQSQLITKPTRTAGMTDEEINGSAPKEKDTTGQMGALLSQKLAVLTGKTEEVKVSEIKAETKQSSEAEPKKFDPNKFKSYLRSLDV